jgi:hypothetical protein
MSSHHFVKEGQEPALIIVDAIPVAVVEPLLEWAPLVIVMENAIEQTSAWGIKTDVVISAAANTQAMIEKLMDQMPVKILSFNHPDEQLDIAFYYLLSNRQYIVNIITQHPEEYILKATGFTDRLEIIVMNEEIKWFSVQNGHFTKWIPANTELLIRETTGEITVSDGAERSGNRVVSKTDGLITLTCEQLFWVGERL